MSSFSDPKAIVGEAENATRHVPGLNDVHRMSALLLAESTPPEGRVLVVGAGGGMELHWKLAISAGKNRCAIWRGLWNRRFFRQFSPRAIHARTTRASL